SRPGRYSDRSVLPCGPRVSFAKTPAPPARTRRTVSEAQEASRRPSSGAPPHDEHQHAALLRPRGVPSPARSEGPSPALHRPGLRDRDGPVLRFGRRDPGRRPLRAAGVPAGRRGRVLHAARARGDGGADADLGLLRRVHPPLPGSLGRVHHRVDVRLRDADRVPGGPHRARDLHALLVPGHRPVGLGGGHAADRGRREPRLRALVRGAGVRVHDREGRCGGRDDRGRRGDPRLRPRRRRDADGPFESHGRRRLLPERSRRVGQRAHPGALRLRRHRDHRRGRQRPGGSGGSGVVGGAGAEAEDPAEALPRAVSTVPVRLLLFYVLAIGVIVLLTPWRQITGEESPFVQIFDTLGVSWAAAALNIVVITAALSAINADLFGAGRVVAGMARHRLAPEALSRTVRGVPVMTTLAMLGVLVVGVVLNWTLPDEVFTIVASLATFATVFVWLM